jgi:AhpD family alkylhydroperoxidase
MSNRIEYAKVSPAGYKAFGGVYVYLQNCGLPKELIDLVYLRVSQINGCAYCIDMHSRDLLKLGVTVDKLVLVPVWHEAGEVFSTRERAALAWAETVTRVAETGVPDADYEAAAGEFSDKELADLTYAIGLMNAFNRIGSFVPRSPGCCQESLKYHGPGYRVQKCRTVRRDRRMSCGHDGVTPTLEGCRLVRSTGDAPARTGISFVGSVA